MKPDADDEPRKFIVQQTPRSLSALGAYVGSFKDPAKWDLKIIEEKPAMFE